MVKSDLTMTTVGCNAKVLSPAQIIPGDGDFEVAKLPRLQWQQKKGESHEIHPPSKDQPGIVVHICEDPEGYKQGEPIAQTRCPERKT